MAQHTSSGTRHAPAHATPRAVRRMVTTLFFLPMTALTVFSKTRASAASVLAATTAGARSVASSLSGTLEFAVIKKLFDGVYELFSGFFELGALVFCFSLIFWVSGLFLGLAVCSVFVACACCYVLLCAVGMNWCLDRIRVYLRDCLVLRMCSVCIPMVSVLRGLRFTCGVTVHFPDKSMVWILHAGHWVVRLCWRHCFEPMAWIRGVQGESGVRSKQQDIQDGRELGASAAGTPHQEDSSLLRNL